MASSKGKTRDRSGKKQITRRISHSDTHSRVRSVCHKHANTLHQRQLYDSINIPQLVYELLTIDKYNHDARRFPSPKRFETHCRGTQNSKRQRLSYEAVDHWNGLESVQMPEYTIESKPTSTDSLTEATDAANSSAPTSSANSSVSNVSMEPITIANSLSSAKALFRKRSLIQLINSYIKTGVEEGKRQAKKYICKALSFGVRSGYLIPTDRQGNMLRVCPTLDTQSWNWRRADIESRRRRRIARRGKTNGLTTIAERKAMRRGIPRDKFLYNTDNKQTASKRKMRPARNPVKSLNTRESNPRKSSPKSPLHVHEKSKPKAFVKKNSKINNVINNKRRQQKRNDGNIKKSIKRHCTSFSKCAQNDPELIEESYKDVSNKDHNQYESNEDNYRIEKQKSTSSQENGSRMEKRKIEANINSDRIDYARIESRNSNDENNDKRSEKESVEHDLNDKAIKEMEF